MSNGVYLLFVAVLSVQAQALLWQKSLQPNQVKMISMVRNFFCHKIDDRYIDNESFHGFSFHTELVYKWKVEGKTITGSDGPSLSREMDIPNLSAVDIQAVMTDLALLKEQQKTAKADESSGLIVRISSSTSLQFRVTLKVDGCLLTVPYANCHELSMADLKPIVDDKGCEWSLASIIATTGLVVTSLHAIWLVYACFCNRNKSRVRSKDLERESHALRTVQFDGQSTSQDGYTQLD